MRNEQAFLDVLDRAENQRRARRNFIKLCGGTAAMAGSLSLLSACNDGESPTASDTNNFPSVPTGTVNSLDVDILNFALNLEYLEANYYTYAVAGAGIATSLQTGVGTQGAVLTGTGAGAARAVSFTNQVIAQYAREIAADEIAHVTFLRNQLGASAVAQPQINLSGSATVTTAAGANVVGAFTAAARAAGVITGSGANGAFLATDIFDPFASDINFLIGSYLLTDVGVSAYRGSARLITNKTFLEASAGILATEAYHDGVIRSSLYAQGATIVGSNRTVIDAVNRISDSRDSLDGATDTDQGIAAVTTTGTPPVSVVNPAIANLVPTDANGLTLGRTATQVLNVVYLAAGAPSSGGFFPTGVNGNIRTAASGA